MYLELTLESIDCQKLDDSELETPSCGIMHGVHDSHKISPHIFLTAMYGNCLHPRRMHILPKHGIHCPCLHSDSIAWSSLGSISKLLFPPPKFKKGNFLLCFFIKNTWDNKYGKFGSWKFRLNCYFELYITA